MLATLAELSNVQVRVRAVPLEPSSPVAKELRGRTTTNSSPFRIDWQQQQASGPDRLLQVQSPSKDAFTAASDIISFEQRKVNWGAVCGEALDVASRPLMSRACKHSWDYLRCQPAHIAASAKHFSDAYMRKLFVD